jgi:hypothetical protein
MSLSTIEKSMIRSGFKVPPRDFMLTGPKGEKYKTEEERAKACFLDLQRKGLI